TGSGVWRGAGVDGGDQLSSAGAPAVSLAAAGGRRAWRAGAGGDQLFWRHGGVFHRAQSIYGHGGGVPRPARGGTTGGAQFALVKQQRLDGYRGGSFAMLQRLNGV